MKIISLHQYMTPEWAAQELVETYYGDLCDSDLVLEPSCGTGSFLKALPSDIPAIGIEIDSSLAEVARRNTGRRVLCGDFRMIDLEGINPTVVLGNPPFSVRTVNAFLERSAQLLPEEGRCGLLLSTYLLQTPSTVLRWNETWSIDQRMVPRTLFPRSIRPLVFVMFRKDAQKIITGGFALYRASAEVSQLDGRIKRLLIEGRPLISCWKAIVEDALSALGGTATLDEIYRWVEPRRRMTNKWWKEKVRQTLQRHFEPVDRGVWRKSA